MVLYPVFKFFPGWPFRWGEVRFLTSHCFLRVTQKSHAHPLRWANYTIRLRSDILIPVFDVGLRVIADEKGEEGTRCER